MENTAKSRFYETMELLGLTDYRVYTDVEDITKNMMVKLRKGETGEVSIKILVPYCTKYEDVNPEYILTGRGNPLKNSISLPMINNIPATQSNVPATQNNIKILDIRVSAGHGIGFEGDENKVVGYMNIPDFTGCYGITVYGDSMYDKYMSGDTIFVREIKDKTLIDNGQPYVVITKEDRLLKLVYIEKTGLKLVSYNPICNPDGRRRYPDMEIDGSQILHLYKVVGKLARTQM